MSDVKRGIAYELHKPARTHFPRRQITQKGIKNMYSADLIDMQSYEKENQNFNWILIVIDIFSKKTYSENLKNKTGVENCKALEKILDRAGNCKILCTDMGKEFTSKIVQAMLKERGIRHFTTYNTHHAAHAERVIRTLKTNLFREFSIQGSYKWIDLFPRVVDQYNNTIHSIIKLKPNDVKPRHESMLLRNVFRKKKYYKHQPKYEENDFVRISKARHVFHKSYTGNWSTEIFKIKSVQHTKPTTYLLESLNGEPILGAFYGLELQKTKYPNQYLIEKILKKNKNRYFVKWLNFSDEHNSWINKEDIL